MANAINYYNALLGKLFNNGIELPLRGGLNFIGLTIVPSEFGYNITATASEGGGSGDGVPGGAVNSLQYNGGVDAGGTISFLGATWLVGNSGNDLLGAPGGRIRSRVLNSDDDLTHDIPAGKSYIFKVNGANRLTLSSTVADWNGSAVVGAASVAQNGSPAATAWLRASGGGGFHNVLAIKADDGVTDVVLARYNSAAANALEWGDGTTVTQNLAICKATGFWGVVFGATVQLQYDPTNGLDLKSHAIFGVSSLAMAGPITGVTSLSIAAITGLTSLSVAGPITGNSLALAGAITGATSIAGTSAAIAGPITNVTTLNGARVLAPTQGTNLVAGNQTLNISGGSNYYMPAGTTTAICTKTLGLTGAANKRVITIAIAAQAHNVNIADDIAGLIHTVVAGTADIIDAWYNQTTGHYELGSLKAMQ